MARKSKRAGTLSDRPAVSVTGRHYKAGIYARLSVKKEEKSDSIDVQIEIARKFVESWNSRNADKIEVADCYMDLGKTGTSFERDEFKRLMQDVRLGDINCIIVKDLSRFGRNYLEAGNYIEKVFPFLGVRFIAVADGFDTVAEGNESRQMSTEIKNLVNDMYAKDFSVKARLSLSQRRREGSYVGGAAPYGYRAVKEEKLRKLVPDEKTADIVREIFIRFIEAESYKAVADELNRRRVNPPSVYHKSGEAYCPEDCAYKGWDKGYLEVLLKNQVYLGRLVQGKTKIAPGRERKQTGAEEWVITENAHEPLVETGIFRQAEEVHRKIREKSAGHGHPTKGHPVSENVFEDVLFCGVCGRKMTRHSHVRSLADGSKKRVDEYVCGNSVSTKTDQCPDRNYIVKNHLVEILFLVLDSAFKVCLKRQKEYEREGKAIVAARTKKLEQEIAGVRREQEDVEGRNRASYMEYRMGKLSREELTDLRQQRETELQEMKGREARLVDAVAVVENKEKDYLKAIRALIRLKDERVFTRELVNALIEKVYVYPGKRVEVVFTFEDAWRELGVAE